MPTLPEQSIEVNSLTKKYGSFTAVDNVSFSVKRGEIFAFLGPNGSGKTTTIKMLTTLLRPTSGTMLVNGYNPATSQDAVRRSFGIVFQDPSLDDELTAYENMQLHSRVDGLRWALAGTSHFGIGLDLAVLGGTTLFFLAVGSYLFSKIEI